MKLRMLLEGDVLPSKLELVHVSPIVVLLATIQRTIIIPYMATYNFTYQWAGHPSYAIEERLFGIVSDCVQPSNALTPEQAAVRVNETCPHHSAEENELRAVLYNFWPVMSNIASSVSEDAQPSPQDTLVSLILALKRLDAEETVDDLKVWQDLPGFMASVHEELRSMFIAITQKIRMWLGALACGHGDSLSEDAEDKARQLP